MLWVACISRRVEYSVNIETISLFKHSWGCWNKKSLETGTKLYIINLWAHNLPRGSQGKIIKLEQYLKWKKTVITRKLCEIFDVYDKYLLHF